MRATLCALGPMLTRRIGRWRKTETGPPYEARSIRTCTNALCRAHDQTRAPTCDAVQFSVRQMALFAYETIHRSAVGHGFVPWIRRAVTLHGTRTMIGDSGHRRGQGRLHAAWPNQLWPYHAAPPVRLNRFSFLAEDPQTDLGCRPRSKQGVRTWRQVL